MMTIKLNKREKYYVSAAICCIVLFLVFQGIVFPLVEKRNQLKRRADVLTDQLQSMQSLAAEYNALREKAEAAKIILENREAGFSLFSFLDELVGKTGLRDKISYMKPSTTEGPDTRFKISAVEMKLQGITVEKLVQYLYHVENSGKSAQVKRLSISEAGKQEAVVDVVLQVETLEVSS